MPFFDNIGSDRVPTAPVYDSSGPAFEKWQAVRNQEEPVLLTALGAVLHGRWSSLPPFVACGTGEPIRDDAYWSWDVADALPRSGNEINLVKSTDGFEEYYLQTPAGLRRLLAPLIHHHADFQRAMDGDDALPEAETEAGWLDYRIRKLMTPIQRTVREATGRDS